MVRRKSTGVYLRMTLSHLKKLAEEATPGPWKLEFRRLIGPEIYRDCGDKLQIAYSKDAEFIAAANPQTILELISRIEGLSDALKDSIDTIHSEFCSSRSHSRWCLEPREALQKYGADKELG